MIGLNTRRTLGNAHERRHPKTRSATGRRYPLLLARRLAATDNAAPQRHRYPLRLARRLATTGSGTLSCELSRRGGASAQPGSRCASSVGLRCFGGGNPLRRFRNAQPHGIDAVRGRQLEGQPLSLHYQLQGGFCPQAQPRRFQGGEQRRRFGQALPRSCFTVLPNSVRAVGQEEHMRTDRWLLEKHLPSYVYNSCREKMRKEPLLVTMLKSMKRHISLSLLWWRPPGVSF